MTAIPALMICVCPWWDASTVTTVLIAMTAICVQPVISVPVVAVSLGRRRTPAATVMSAQMTGATRMPTSAKQALLSMPHPATTAPNGAGMVIALKNRPGFSV
jgi:hypothetical protein